MLRDLSLAIRSLTRSPGLTGAALATLAVGIGATTLVFSVVQTVLLDSLAYRDPDRLVRLFATNPDQGIERAGLAGLDFFDFRDRLTVFEHLGAYQWFGLGLSEDGRTHELRAILATPGLLGTLGTPLLGRTFLEAEGEVGGDRVVVLSHAFWRDRLGGQGTVLGSTLRLDGEDWSVVGVMPADFVFPVPGIEIWAPWVIDRAEVGRRAHWWETVGKLAPGVELEQAEAELRLAASALEQEFPVTNQGWSALVVPLHETVVGAARPALLALVGAVVLVLLIACANVAGLLLARGLTRDGEMALRAALGAGHGRLVRQLLTESLVLALAGGAAGLALATLGLRILVRTAPERLPRVEEIGLDVWVAGFALAVTLASGLLFGVVPALRISGDALTRGLRGGGQSRAEGGRTALRAAITVGQLALSLVLLLGAGLLLRSFLAVLDVDPGFRVEKRIATQLFLYGENYPDDPSRRAFLDRLGDELRALPGVESLGLTDALPLAELGGGVTSVRVDGRAEDEKQMIALRSASLGFFETLGVTLRSGRTFDDQDHADAERVGVVSESAARVYFGDDDPLGRRLVYQTRGGDGPIDLAVTVVGVVADVRSQSLEIDPPPTMYMPMSQYMDGAVSVVVKSTGDPAALLKPIEERVWALDPGQAIWRTVVLDRLIEEDTAARRFHASLVLLFAVVALLLAAVGLYGLVSYGVTERTREIGLRVAVGARAVDVLSMVLRQGSVLVVCGLVVGLALSGLLVVALSRTFAELLFRVEPADPVTFVMTSLVLAAVALVSCLIPARRAMRLDPVVALRDG